METIRIFAVAKRKDAFVSGKVSRKAQKATKEISFAKNVAKVKLTIEIKKKTSRTRRSGERRRGIKWFTQEPASEYANCDIYPAF